VTRTAPLPRSVTVMPDSPATAAVIASIRKSWPPTKSSNEATPWPGVVVPNSTRISI